MLEDYDKDANDYFILGYLDMISDKDEEAYEYFKLSLAKENDSTNMFAKIYSRKYLATKEYKEGNKEAGISYIKSAYRLLDKKDINRYYEVLVDTLMVGVDFDEESRYLALNYLNSMLNLKVKLSNKAKFYINYRLAPLCVVSGKYAEAIESTLNCIVYAREKNLDYEEAKTTVDLGLVFRQLSRYDIAKNTIEASLEVEIDDKKEDAAAKLYALINLADIAAITGNYDEAIDRVNEMDRYINYVKDSEDKDDYEIVKYIVLGDVNIHKNNLSLAEEYIDKAKDLMKKNKVVYLADNDIYLLDTLGELEGARGNYEEALEYFNEARVLANKRHNTEYEILVIQNICDIYNKENDLENLAAHQEHLLNLLNREKETIGEDYVYYSSTLREKQHMLKEESIRKYRETLYILIVLLVSLILYKYMNKLIKANRYDSLTRVYNRGRFNKTYNKLLKSKDSNYTIAMIDIDNFKSINDTYGHDIGDVVLIKVCNIVRNGLEGKRKLYRYGGEEFVIIFKDEDKEKVALVTERIRRSIEAMVWKEDLNVTISMGIASSEKESFDVLKRADQNLYKSKTNGKNKITFE